VYQPEINHPEVNHKAGALRDDAERKNLLPAIATAATTAAASATVSAIAAATATAEASTPTSTSGSALGLGPGFIDVDGASADLRSVQRSDRLLAIFVAGHLDKTESAGASRVAVCQDANAVDLAVALEDLPQFILICVETEVPHKNILHASSPALSCRKCELSSANLAGLGGLPENRDRSWQQSNAGGSIAGFPQAACQFEFNLQMA
jgi:hypothetical protein